MLSLGFGLDGIGSLSDCHQTKTRAQKRRVFGNDNLELYTALPSHASLVVGPSTHGRHEAKLISPHCRPGAT